MSNLVSVIIPIAPYHKAQSDNAIASAHAQTIPCEVVTIVDSERRGAGWARNRGVEEVQSLFVVFLDADDTLQPDFVASALAYYQQGSYVYTDHYDGRGVYQTPDTCAWHYGQWHAVTTLLPTALFRLVEGFSESLPGMEDCDLYLKLQAANVCGRRCPKPLLTYTGNGLRSQGFTTLANFDIIRNNIYEHYAQRIGMGCGCGAKSDNIQAPERDKQPGDILAQALYTPMPMIGPMTGRNYPRPRGFEGYRLWVAREDIMAKPGMWQPVEGSVDPKDISPDIDEVLQLAGAALGK